MMKFIPRSIEKKLLARASERPCILVTGARQTGKTTLLKNSFPDTQYLSFDSILLAASAAESPEEFVEQFTDPVILDEVQYVPTIFRALKVMIDQDRDSRGKYLLTGSQTYELMKGISQSLAGRIGIIKLETLSAREIIDSGSFDRESLNLLPIRGGYPELWRNPDIDAGPWFEDYIRTYIERDLRELVRVRDLVQFRRLMAALAHRTGQLLNYADLSRSCGVSLNTVKAWVAALETSGIVYILPPWFSNSEKRLIRSPKLYFADPGLVCGLLNIRDIDELKIHNTSGSVWENFVFSELVKSGGWEPGRTLFFYRDHANVEVDFVGISGDRRILVEAKYSQRIRQERLGFSTAASLIEGDPELKRFLDQLKIERFVAAPTGEDSTLPFKDYTIYDPKMGQSPII
jgi:predicted AAA+ superfamily ATPase